MPIHHMKAGYFGNSARVAYSPSCQDSVFNWLMSDSVFQLYAIARPSVVCNVRAPYSGGSNFWQYFYGIRYLGHPLTSAENFMEIVPGEPSAGELNTRGVAKYSDFGPIDGYISETVQDRR